QTCALPIYEAILGALRPPGPLVHVEDDPADLPGERGVAVHVADGAADLRRRLARADPHHRFDRGHRDEHQQPHDHQGDGDLDEGEAAIGAFGRTTQRASTAVPGGDPVRPRCRHLIHPRRSSSGRPSALRRNRSVSDSGSDGSYFWSLLEMSAFSSVPPGAPSAPYEMIVYLPPSFR